MQCLVTGGAGFIGSTVVRALLRQGDAVRVLDNFSTGKRENLLGLESDIDVHACDLEDGEGIAKALHGVECVFHLAARVSVPESVRYPRPDQHTNCALTLDLLDRATAAGVRRFVYSSSAAVYGDSSDLPLREAAVAAPISPYGVSKYAGELYTRMYARAYGLEAIALRYFNVYGPRQDPGSSYSGVLSRFLAAVAANTAPVIFGDGRQTRDFVFAGDVAEANLRAQAAPAAVCGRAFNIASGVSVSLIDIIATLQDLTGQPIRPRFEAARAGDVRHSSADTAAAARDLGFRARIGLSTGLEQTLAWLRQCA